MRNNGQGGLDASGSIQVNVAYNRSTTFVPTLKIQGTASNPAWNFTATGTATANVTSTTPTLTTVTAVDGASGPATVTINFSSAITNAYVQIVLNASAKTDLLVDNITASTFTSLPVELTRFDATAKGAGVALTWATASEKNSDRFEIQRSATGEVYETLGTVKGQGNTTMAHDYSFVDSRPLAGTSYYRLRQVDSDGTFSFSPVAAVQTEASTKVELYPNPSANQLILPAGVGAVQYRIFNALGQTLLSGKATDNDRLDITSLPKGPFFLEMSGATGRHTQRLMRE
ncbi:T9SS type A sorting domain-containing protein [Hymenobacter ruber]